MSLDGLLLIDKQGGCTSHDVVQQVRRALRQKRVGHCGTLDPDATGLLLVTVGQATRLTRFLIHAPKVYEGTIRFGIATDTYDASGRVVAEKSLDGLTTEAIDAAMQRFIGTFAQQLPAYSARKVGGVKFYELARRGEEIPETTKEVTVGEFARLGTLDDGRIIHFRPSGNAPEMRCYVEAESSEAAEALLSRGLSTIRRWTETASN